MKGNATRLCALQGKPMPWLSWSNTKKANRWPNMFFRSSVLSSWFWTKQCWRSIKRTAPSSPIMSPDSATHVVMCPESMARQSRTVPSAQEIRAKYSLVDACFILRRCYIYIYICYEGTLWLICGVGDLNGIHWRTNAHEPLDPFDSLAIRSLHNVRGHWIGLLTRMLRKLEGMMLVLSMAHLRPVACSLRT